MVSIVVVVAATAGSTGAVPCTEAEGAGLVPACAGDAGVAEQPVIATIAATASDNADPRILPALADLPSDGVVPLLIT
ncbi:hypothetical protein [Paenarthrobacter nicotinovorans]|uniref:hypothetical protein n=1 Tax=Paenarthrobacter nicotinovorans TaxID=29320 RepID=UPI0012DBF434|nr:hypothetical protein [Paenarthrobacter nicotinovorans]